MFSFFLIASAVLAYTEPPCQFSRHSTKYVDIIDKEFLLMRDRHNLYKLHVHGRRLYTPALADK